MKRIKFFKDFDKVNEISNELVDSASRKMIELGQKSRGNRLLDKHFDLEKMFPNGSLFGKSPSKKNYYIDSIRITNRMYLTFEIKLRLDGIDGHDILFYKPDADKLYINGVILDFKNQYITFNREEARRLSKLVKKINPDTSYANGTKDLPIEGYQ